MGVLNVTPDSFSDGGEFYTKHLAVQRAQAMILEGADILDIGGESTGPGSQDVGLAEELSRVIPVIEAIRQVNTDIWISVDTWKAEVARQALMAGADMVNDVTGLRGDPLMVDVLSRAGVPVVLMYAKDDSARTTNEVVHYDDVVGSIMAFWAERMAYATSKGVTWDQIVLDPGMGSFVSADAKYSMEILERLREFEVMEQPLLVGASRKGFIRDVWGGEKPKDRLEGSLMAAQMAALNGAHIIRAHDVEEHRRCLDVSDRLVA
jgi:dihydropteroate synthase